MMCATIAPESPSGDTGPGMIRATHDIQLHILKTYSLR